jgi:SWI/SNF-related matrix-associated actin-dependent regulator of chromatin subfamily A3
VPADPAHTSGQCIEIVYRLNLTVASRIYIVEPQWNPSVESQAIGRALRLGQEKQVTVVRYIMENTVEQVF